MGADFLALVEGKERDAQRVVLRNRFAYDLTGLVSNLLFERQNRGFFNILETGHNTSSQYEDVVMIPAFSEISC